MPVSLRVRKSENSDVTQSELQSELQSERELTLQLLFQLLFQLTRRVAVPETPKRSVPAGRAPPRMRESTA